MVALNLLSTFLMGLAVVAVFLAVTRIGTKREPPRAVPEERSRVETWAHSAESIARSPAVWTVTFVVLAVGMGLAAIAAVGDLGLPESVVGPLLGVVGGIIGLLLAGFVFYGTYSATRARGLGNAHGIAAGTLMLGLVLLLVIAARLVAS